MFGPPLRPVPHDRPPGRGGHPLGAGRGIVEKSGQQAGGTTSDFDGNYTIKPIQPGSYVLKASFVGYKPVLITGLAMIADRITFLNIEMEATMVEIETFEVVNL
jgi:hypothetical protein